MQESLLFCGNPPHEGGDTMICPFFSTVETLAVCQEADCAIWVPEKQACSILVIATKPTPAQPTPQS